MRPIDADEIFYDQLLNTGHKEHPIEFAVSKKIIDDMPTIEPQRWTPVTERLPKESDGRVLITRSGKVETGIYSEFSKRWYIGDMNGVGGDDPIAWMPLPEPWKGEEDESTLP